MKQHRALLSVLSVCVLLLAIGSASQAAVGLVRWSAVGSDPTATITYRLNLTASSGTIEIRDAGTNAVVKTISLAGSQLMAGTHSVAWDGTNGSGASAPSGSYYARVNVSKASVAAPGIAHRIRDHTGQAPLAHRYYGVDADNNPAHNNQANPAASSFGNIYLANSTSKKIEVWLPGGGPPDAPGDYANPVFGSAAEGPGWASAFTGGSAPLGLGVSQSGRVFSTDRSANRHANWNWDGSDRKGTTATSLMGNTRDCDAIGIDPAGDGVFHAAISSAIKFGAEKQGADYQPPNDYNAFQTLATWGTPPDAAWGMGFQNEQATIYNAVWFAAGCGYDALNPPATAPAGAVFKYTGTGTYWNLAGPAPYTDYVLNPDTSFSLSITGAADISFNPKDQNVAAIARQTQGDTPQHNVEVWNLGSMTKVQDFHIAPMATPTDATGRYLYTDTNASRVAFDAWGNAVVVAGTAFPGYWAYLYELPDSGSNDSRDTVAFTHTWGNVPPVIVSCSASPDTIPLDDATSTTLTIVVRDPDGFADIASVVVDLSALGYGSAVAAAKVSDDGDKTATYQLTGVTAKPSSRAGAISLPVQATDNHAATGSEVLLLNTTGGTLSGAVTHKDGGFGIVGATVSATDGTNVYTATTGAGGAYTLSVNPGTFTVNASKANYGAGTASTATAVALGGSATPATDAKLGSITLAAARAAAPGSSMCVTAVVCAAGYTPTQAANKLPKFYIRDGSGANDNGLITPTSNLGFRVYYPAASPVEGDKVVIEADKIFNIFEETRFDAVTNYAKIASGAAYPGPDAGVADDVNDSMNNLSDVRWGNLITLGAVTVESVTPNAYDDWHEFTVRDSSSDIAGRVLVWKATPGVTEADLPGVGAIINVTGMLSRRFLPGEANIANRPNVVEVRSKDDLLTPTHEVGSAGAAKQWGDNNKVTITNPMIVTEIDAGFFYVQDEDGTSGIRIDGLPSVALNDKVMISDGLMGTTAAGERQIVAATVTPAGTGTTPVRKMRGNAVGGEGYAIAAGSAAEFGLNNQGLLVKILGKVVHADFDAPDGSYTFVLEDGCAVFSGLADKGIRVYNSGGFPTVGQYVSVVGVISADKIGSDMVPVLRGRQLFDEVVTLAP